MDRFSLHAILNKPGGYDLKSVPFQVQDIIKDPAGRYVIIKGMLLTEIINLVNIYGPNKNDPRFYSNIFILVFSLLGQHIIAGDMNCTLDPEKDRSTSVDNTYIYSRKQILHFMTELNLSDIWRHLHPTLISYSCYSATHQTYSRIENCFYFSSDAL